MNYKFEPKSASKRQKLSIILALMVFVFMANSFFQSLTILSNTAKQIAETKEKLASLEEENKSLKNETNEVQTPYFQEKEARDRLGLAKEGEVVLILPEESKLKALSPLKNEDETQEEIENEPNWKKWLNLFTSTN